MRIDEIIKADKIYTRYEKRYSNPLIAFFHDSIPERMIKKFIKQATTEELALYFFAYLGLTPIQVVGFFAHLERRSIHTLEIVEGIYTSEFWEMWHFKNLVAIMDQAVVFGK